MVTVFAVDVPLARSANVIVLHPAILLMSFLYILSVPGAFRQTLLKYGISAHISLVRSFWPVFSKV